jgi:hypothetical protein
MSNTPATYKIENVTVGAINLLRDCLSQSGWAKGIADIIVGGQLLAEIVPEVPGEPIAPNNMLASPQEKIEFKAAHAKWASAITSSFELTEKQRDTCKQCIRHLVEKQQIQPGKYSLDMLKAFGLIE